MGTDNPEKALAFDQEPPTNTEFTDTSFVHEDATEDATFMHDDDDDDESDLSDLSDDTDNGDGTKQQALKFRVCSVFFLDNSSPCSLACAASQTPSTVEATC